MTHSDFSSTASAFWITSPGQGFIRDASLAPSREGHVHIRTLYSAISRGTESLVYTGAVPASEHARMRAPFQEGEFSFPVKYGYINVGVVEQGPAELLNKHVFCLYPHQTHYVVPVDSVTVLPDSLPAARAVLCANMETAVNALWDAAPAVGDRISVVGAGVVGCLVAWLASRIPGCDVELIDINASRQSVATQLGLNFRVPAEASDVRDLVIHASASEAGLQSAMALAAKEATIVELSWYGDKRVSVALGGAFHSQRLTLKSSQVGSVPADHQARWHYARRLQLAMSLINDDQLDYLISGESHFRDLPAEYDAILSDSQNALCHRIRYDDSVF